MAEYEVVETFTSINGEGQKAGELAFFIRFKGCNLNCSYCDTTWANCDTCKATVMTEKEIYGLILDSGINNVTITGGEPLFRKDIEVLLDMLNNDDRISVEIETNGSVSLEKFIPYCSNISFTMDYKLPLSGMENRMNLDNFSCLRSNDTVKFVVGGIEDLDKANEIIERYNLLDKTKCYFSPVFGKIDPKDIVDYMKKNKLNAVRLQLQLHKFIWDPEEKGV